MAVTQGSTPSRRRPAPRGTGSGPPGQDRRRGSWTMRWHSRGGRSLFFPKTVTPSRVVDPSATSVSHPTFLDSRTRTTPVKGARPWLSSGPVRITLVLLLVTANTALAHSPAPRIYDLVAGD